MMTKFSPPKPTGKSPFPVNLDEIAEEPKRFVESAVQSLGLKPDIPAPDLPSQLPQQEAQEKAVAQQKMAQVRSNIQRIREEEMAAIAKAEEENRPTSRLSQDQPPPPPDEAQNAILNPPSAPKKHLMPGAVAAAKKKATQIETRARVAGT